MVSWGRLKLEKEDEDEKNEKKASKDQDKFVAGLVQNRTLKEKKKKIDRLTWTTDEKGAPTTPAGADAWLQDLIHTTDGLGRTGRISVKAMRSCGELIKQWQRSIEAGDKEADLNDYFKGIFRKLYFLYMNAVGITEQEIAPPIVWAPVIQKPYGDREGQKLIPD